MFAFAKSQCDPWHGERLLTLIHYALIKWLVSGADASVHLCTRVPSFLLCVVRAAPWFCCGSPLHRDSVSAPGGLLVLAVSPLPRLSWWVSVCHAHWLASMQAPAMWLVTGGLRGLPAVLADSNRHKPHLALEAARDGR